MKGKPTLARASWVLMIFFLISLAACLFFHVRITALEAEKAELYRRLLDHWTFEDSTRLSEISKLLQNTHGLNYWRRRAAFGAGASGLGFLFVNLERLKQYLYRKMK